MKRKFRVHCLWNMIRESKFKGMIEVFESVLLKNQETMYVTIVSAEQVGYRTFELVLDAEHRHDMCVAMHIIMMELGKVVPYAELKEISV